MLQSISVILGRNLSVQSVVLPDAVLASRLDFGAWNWLPWVIAFAILSGGFILWGYARGNVVNQSGVFAPILKFVALGLLAFCLLEPQVVSERPVAGANVLAVLVDQSSSMNMKTGAGIATLAERFSAKLASEAEWQTRLGQDFDLRRYTFDARLDSVADFDQLEFSGQHSAIRSALTSLESRFAARPLAGLVLFTDGLATDDLAALVERSEFSFPIFPIVSDLPTKPKDVSISDASLQMSAFELAPIGLTATVRATGLPNEKIVVTVSDDTGKVIEEQILDCDGEDFQRRIRMQFRARDTGFQFVKLQASLASERVQDKPLESLIEVTVANNSQLLAVDRGGGPYRILYVAGRPNWEFKFLRRALSEDLEIELKGLVRIAKEEPKFSFRDKGVQTANPLMAGFSDDEETAEQYDEPVLTRFGVEEDELRGGFPGSEEDLFHYHAIVLDDVEASFFTPQQMLLLREFVSERGGGFMMLGGQESFLGGGYRDTPLADVLPVYLRGAERPESKREAARLSLTREGALEPWLRLRENLPDEQQRLREMPGFQTWNAVSEIKPGASILSDLNTDGGSFPGLVAQRFGKGKSMAVLVGDFWRWSMRRQADASDDLAQTWRQIARFLTSDVPRRVEVQIESPSDSLGPHAITVTCRDAGFKPLDNSQISIQVTEPDGTQVQASAVADPDRAGVYVADYWSNSDGGYRCEVLGAGPDGEELPTVKTGWVAAPSAAEFAEVELDRRQLETLAEHSGGKLVEISSLGDFANNFPVNEVLITEPHVEPLWQRPWMILFAIACLCAEWSIRRWKGLP